MKKLNGITLWEYYFLVIQGGIKILLEQHFFASIKQISIEILKESSILIPPSVIDEILKYDVLGELKNKHKK